MVAFRWNDDLSDADAVPDGEMNARELKLRDKLGINWEVRIEN